MNIPLRLTSGAAPRALAFDLDETLIACDSTVRWTEWLYETGTVTDPVYRLLTERMLADYRAGTLDIRAYLRRMAPALSGLCAPEFELLTERFVEKRILPTVHPQALWLIAKAKRANLPMTIVSASATHIVRPIARRLGIGDAIGIDIAERDGVPTGEVIGTPSFREGKVVRLEEWLRLKNRTHAFAERPLTFGDVLFLTDSRNDLPLARRAGGCALVNPDPVIRAEGEKRGWTILHWNSAAVERVRR